MTARTSDATDAYDALVIGARVAGATVAALLGDAGRRVLLVDRAAFPSPTVSTHYFRGDRTVAVLQRLGVLETVLALGPPRLVCSYHHVPGVAEPVVRPPAQAGAAGYNLSVRRGPLDAILLNRAARTPGVQVRERTRLLELLRVGGRVAGARLAGPRGERTVRARIVVGADGRRSAVARAVRAPATRTDPPYRALFYRYYRGFPGPHGGPPDGMEVALVGDELAYVFPSDAGLACLAVSVNLGDYARLRRAPGAVLSERLAARPGLAGRLAAAVPVGRVAGCGPEASYVRVPGGPGWALVGDAGLHLDPWTGNGMDFAATQAQLLVASLDDWFAGRASEADALAAYRARRDELCLPVYERTTEEARDLRRTALMELVRETRQAAGLDPVPAVAWSLGPGGWALRPGEGTLCATNRCARAPSGTKRSDTPDDAT
jgi:flavin-dependent dehydrogenase